MRNSASSPSLEAHIESSHAGSRRIKSLQALPEDYENSAPYLPEDEGLPELSFDDTIVDPQFFAEDETSLEQSITQKDTSLPPERQLHHAQNPGMSHHFHTFRAKGWYSPSIFSSLIYRAPLNIPRLMLIVFSFQIHSPRSAPVNYCLQATIKDP